MYAVTIAGAHVRLWRCGRDQTELVPFWGPNNSRDWSQFKDVGNDRAGQEIEYWFGKMKRLPPTPHAGQSSHTYGTASTIAPSHQAPGLDYQAATYSLPASTFSYQAPDQNYQAVVPGYQASTSSYRTTSATSHPTSGYQANLHASTTFLLVSQYGESVASGGKTQTMRDRVGDSEENDEDYQMEEERDSQQSATSTAASDYFIVSVARRAHSFKKDEFIFKDNKGKSRSTTQDDWKRMTCNGRVAWKHH